MDFYIKGYYGYKNFGDEMIIFGLLNYIEKYIENSITTKNKKKKYYLEVQDPQRMKNRIQRNKELLDFSLEKIEYIPIQQDKYKRITHIKTFLGLSKYRKMIKIFGGGELFDANKRFPHNGWNLFILFAKTIFQGKFYLVGGIGQAVNVGQKFLQKILISRAKKVICRDEISCQRAKKYLSKKREENVVCYHDFSYDVYHRVFPSNLKRQYVSSNKIILLNAPYTKTLEKCVVNHLSDATYLLFFPCEYVEDKEYFVSLQQYFPQVEIYDWTKYLLIETLKTFAGACFGVGERLHFCLPLQYYQVPYICVEKKDKQKKLLFN